MNVSLGKVWEQYVADQVDSGLFNNASEVVRDALRRQQEHLVKFEALRRDIDSGVKSIQSGHVVRPTADDVISRAKAKKTRR